MTKIWDFGGIYKFYVFVGTLENPGRANKEKEGTHLQHQPWTTKSFINKKT
jgi:hypothetical protein